MVKNDPLAACLSKINGAELISKKEIVIEGINKLSKAVLAMMKKLNYIVDVRFEENRKGGKMIISLNNGINKCGSIKPRYKVLVSDIEKFEQRYLPAKGFGILIISTSKGLLTNDEAKEKNVGGRLIAYCY